MEIEIYEFILVNYLKGSQKKCKNTILAKKIERNERNLKKVYKFSDKSMHKNLYDDCVFSYDPIGNMDYQSGGFKYLDFVKHYISIPPNTVLNNYLPDQNINVLEGLQNIYDNYSGLEYLIQDVINIHSSRYNIEVDQLEEREGFLYKWNLEDNSKVITFGDYHGSFHTFFRHIERFITLGILDEEFNILKKEYNFMFLGDILDRGLALEIMIIVLLIVKKNPNNIVLNRGNHETHSQYSRSSRGSICFSDELLSKIGNDYNIEDLFFNLFKSCPSAVILSYDNDKRKIWCCHGGIPTQDMSSSSLNKLFKKKYSDIKDRDNLVDKNYVFKDDDLSNGVIHLSRNVADQIRWNDLDWYNDDTIFNDSRGGGAKLSKKTVREFLEKNNIDFFLRGHQDNNANTVLFGSYKTVSKTNIQGGSYIIEEVEKDVYDNGFDIQKHLKDNFKNDERIPSNLKSIHDEFINCNPISRVIVNMDNTNNIQVVESQSNNQNQETIHKMEIDGMTITNNTDCGRSLERDSFVIISFARDNEESLLLSNEDSLSQGSEGSISEQSYSKIDNIIRKYNMQTNNANFLRNFVGGYRKTKKKNKKKIRISKKVNKKKKKNKIRKK